jgi:hypothetical protein
VLDFVVHPYVNKYPYWEVVEVCRKLGFVMIGVFIVKTEDYDAGQIWAGSVFAGFTLMLYTYVKPYRKPHMANYWVTSLSLTLLYILLGWYTMGRPPEDDSALNAAWAVCVINYSFLAVLWLQVVYGMGKTFRTAWKTFMSAKKQAKLVAKSISMAIGTMPVHNKLTQMSRGYSKLHHRLSTLDPFHVPTPKPIPYFRDSETVKHYYTSCDEQKEKPWTLAYHIGEDMWEKLSHYFGHHLHQFHHSPTHNRPAIFGSHMPLQKHLEVQDSHQAHSGAEKLFEKSKVHPAPEYQSSPAKLSVEQS